MAEFDTSQAVKDANAKRKARLVATWQTRNLKQEGIQQWQQYLDSWPTFVQEAKAQAQNEKTAILAQDTVNQSSDNQQLDYVNQLGDTIYGTLQSLGLQEPPQSPFSAFGETLKSFTDSANQGNEDLMWQLPDVTPSQETLQATQEYNTKVKELSDLDASLEQMYNDARKILPNATESYINAYVANKTRDILPKRRQLLSELQLSQSNRDALVQQDESQRANQWQEVQFKYGVQRDQVQRTREVLTKGLDMAQQEYARQTGLVDQVKLTLFNQKIQQDYDQIKFDREQKAEVQQRAQAFADQQTMALFSHQLDLQKQGMQTSMFQTNDGKAVLYNVQTGDVVKTFNLWMSVEDQIKMADLQPVFGSSSSLVEGAYNTAINSLMQSGGKQCGAFVNDYLQSLWWSKVMGDSFESKQKAINSTVPMPWAVFVQSSSEYSANGHTGIVKSVNGDGTITVLEANLKGDKQLSERTIKQSSVMWYHIPNSLYQDFQNAQPVNASKALSGYARGVLDNWMNVNNIPEKQREQTLNEIYAFLEQETKNIKDPGLKSILTSGVKSKDIDSTQLKTITQIKTVDAQLDWIVKSLDEVTTDPIVDILKSKDPYDAKRQALQSQVNAILPSLARWVFSEVGVLTDADIARYEKLVPNANKTWGTNQLIGEMLKKVLYRNYATTLTTLAQASNVRGFASDYDLYMTKLYKMDSTVTYSPWQLLASDKWPIVVDQKKVVVPGTQWPYKANSLSPSQIQVPKKVTKI